MNAAAYQLLANIARYWFIALAVFILVRLVLAVIREMRIEKQVWREIDSAGTNISATLILTSDENKKMKRSKMYVVEGETTIGRSRRCDIRVHTPSLDPVHCILRADTDGLAVVPVGKSFVAVDGRIANRRVVAIDGSSIQMGGLMFTLRLEEENET